MKSTYRLVSALALATVSLSAFAWIDTGHMVIASIAEARLNDKAYKECQHLLAIGGTDKTKDFVGAACWADDVKTPGQAPWHFIDIPYRPDGKPTKTEPAKENVVWAIEKYSAILGDRSKPDADRADALRYLIHFVGDVHQPLHAITMESDAHPNGDRGGNDVRIRADDMFPKWQTQPENLHFLWDCGVGLFPPDYVSRPLNPETSGKISFIAVGLTAKYPEKSFGELVKDMDPMDWAKESNRAAREAAYKIRPAGDIDLTYITIGKVYAGERATLAGYRLAALLNKLLGS